MSKRSLLSPRGRLGYRALCLLMALALLPLLGGGQPAGAQTFAFDAGSNGSDGALNLTTPGVIEFDPRVFAPPLDPDGDNIYHFTTINIAAGVTVRLTGRKLNAPVFWLASGAVRIDGTIDLNGEDGQSTFNLPDCCPAFSVPGAGGYPGGIGSYRIWPSQPGTGPGGGVASSHQAVNMGGFGGGAGHANERPVFGGGRKGAGYGNVFLLPLVGGSGGGGGSEAGGGAGGGALLIASSASIAVNGAITANGGNGGRDTQSVLRGGGGSGGAIRLVAPTISGGGRLSAARGGPTGSNGRIRLEAFQRAFTGSFDLSVEGGGQCCRQPSLASPVAVRLPQQNLQPSVRVVSVANASVPPNPTGDFAAPDATINQTSPATVAIEARNVAVGTVVTLKVFSEEFPGEQTITSTPLAGTLQQSTATASVTIPPGFSWMFVRADWLP